MGLLSAIGGAIGLAIGGPVGAALGSGIGSLASGGDLKDALTSGLMGYGIGSIPGAQAFAQGAAGAAGLNSLVAGAAPAAAGGAAANPLASLFGGAGAGAAGAGAGAASVPAAAAGAGAATAGGLGPFLSGMAKNPLVMASLIEAFQPKGSMMSPLQQQQMATGERLPNYRGTAAPDFRYGGANPSMQRFAMGGFIEGPGTGTSDSIPAKIYQNGGPVQEAMLSDGEFVMTADAVRGAGGGDRGAGAAKMYEMMNRLERRA